MFNLKKVVGQYPEITLGELLVVGLLPNIKKKGIDVEMKLSEIFFEYENGGQKGVRIPRQIKKLLLPKNTEAGQTRLLVALDFILLLRKYNPSWNTKHKELLEILSGEDVFVPFTHSQRLSEYFGLFKVLNPGKKAPKKYEGQKNIFARELFPSQQEAAKAADAKMWGLADLYELLKLPEEATPLMISVLSNRAKHKKSDRCFLTSWGEEVLFGEDGNVSFPSQRRLARTRYTLSVEDLTVFHSNPSHLWSWMLIGWTIRELSDQEWRFLINRDATPLLAPSRVYGDPSPLNRQLDHNNVGHLMMVTSGYWKEGHCTWGTIWKDNDIQAVSKALPYVWAEMDATIIQHQANNLRVGSAAAALGKSTVLWLTPKNELITISISDFQVDKLKKLYNRDSLRTRCAPLVEVILTLSYASNEFKELRSSFAEF